TRSKRDWSSDVCSTDLLLGADPESRLAPEEVLARLNRQLARVLPIGWFVTACYAVIDPARGRFSYSLAGHDAPLIVRARDDAVEIGRTSCRVMMSGQW